jgi:hypothetical protein
MAEGGAGIDEIMLQNENDDVIPRVVMSLDQFTPLSSVLVLIAFAFSVVLCFGGCAIPDISRPSHVQTNGTLTFPLPAFSRFSLFSSFTASAARFSDSDFDATFSINATFEDTSPFRMVPFGSFHARFKFREGANVSNLVHIFTDCVLSPSRAEFHIDVKPPAHYDVFVTSPSKAFGEISTLLAFTGVLILGIIYVVYHAQIQREPAGDVPPECHYMRYLLVFLVLGSSVWQYFLPAAPPLYVAVFTKGATALLVWFQRGIIHALGKGRNVMAPHTISFVELLAFCTFAAGDILKAVVQVRYYFRFPYGKGEDLTFACEAVSLGCLCIWTAMVICAWKRNWFFSLFFALAWIASAGGPVVDEIGRNFKETFFRCYAISVPLVINLYLFVITWPVKTVGLAPEIYE